MAIEVHTGRRKVAFETRGNVSFLRPSPNGDLNFEVRNWNERRRVRFRSRERDWSVRPGRAPDLERRFEFEAERTGCARFPTLVHQRRLRNPLKTDRPKLVIHFHGGPESIEFGEKRYGDVFSRLVSRGHCYASWNYPGSIGFGEEWTTLPRKDWERSILTEWAAVERALRRRYSIPMEDWVFVGTSFGAMVALLIARTRPQIGKVVLISPLLSVRHQVERVRLADPSQLVWFKQRFGKTDFDRLDFSFALADVKGAISIIASGRDEVLGTEVVKAATRSARLQGKSIDLYVQKGCAHSPKSRAARRKREWLLKTAILI